MCVVNDIDLYIECLCKITCNLLSGCLLKSIFVVAVLRGVGWRRENGHDTNSYVYIGKLCLLVSSSLRIQRWCNMFHSFL